MGYALTCRLCTCSHAPDYCICEDDSRRSPLKFPRHSTGRHLPANRGQNRSMTQELDNRNLMLEVVAGFKSGKLEALFAALSPDVIWKATAPREFFRFGGTHRGIAGMKEYTALLFSRYHFTRFAPKILTAKGDQVWGLF